MAYYDPEEDKRRLANPPPSDAMTAAPAMSPVEVQRENQYQLSRLAAQRIQDYRANDAANALPAGSPTQYTNRGQNVGSAQPDELGVRPPTPIGATGLRGFPATSELATAANQPNPNTFNNRGQLIPYFVGEQGRTTGISPVTQPERQVYTPPQFDSSEFDAARSNLATQRAIINAKINGGTVGNSSYSPRTNRNEVRQLYGDLKSLDAQERSVNQQHALALREHNANNVLGLRAQTALNTQQAHAGAITSNFALNQALNQVQGLQPGSPEAIQALNEIAANPDHAHALGTAGGSAAFRNANKYHNEHAALTQYARDNPGTQIVPSVRGEKIVTPQQQVDQANKAFEQEVRNVHPKLTRGDFGGQATWKANADGTMFTDMGGGKFATIPAADYERLKQIHDSIQSKGAIPQAPGAPTPPTRIIERGDKKYEVDDATRKVIREIQ